MTIETYSKILQSNSEYWLIERVEYHGANSIIFCAIPHSVTLGIKKEDIKLSDLEALDRCQITNVFLNKDFPPFQLYQQLGDVRDAFPVTGNIKEFLKKAIQIDSNNIYDYKELIEEPEPIKNHEL